MDQENVPTIAGETTGYDVITDEPVGARQKKTPFILVVTRNGHMAEPVMNYALNVADRLKYSILAVHIDTLPFFRDGGKRSLLFAAAVQESAVLLRQKGEARGVLVKHLRESGKVGKVVQRLCHSPKRIEFVVIDQGIRMGEVASQSPVPVFSVIYTHSRADQINKSLSYKTKKKGATRMSTTSRKRHLKNCLLFGTLTAGLYCAVFSAQDLVMTYFTKGGVYALLPVAIVFAVSYAHGNFTSAFWSALGIEGSKATITKSAEIRPAMPAAVDGRKDTRPRAQLSV